MPSGGSVDNPKLVLGFHSPCELKCINDLILKEIFKKSEDQASLGEQNQLFQLPVTGIFPVANVVEH